MGCAFTQTEIAQPKAEVLIKPSGIDLLTMFFQEALERPVLYSTLVEYAPAQANPLAYFPRRNMKYLSEFALCASILKFRAFVTRPKQLYRSRSSTHYRWRSAWPVARVFRQTIHSWQTIRKRV